MFWQEKEAGSKRCITQSNVTHKAWPEQSAAATLQLWAALSSLAKGYASPAWTQFETRAEPVDYVTAAERRAAPRHRKKVSPATTGHGNCDSNLRRPLAQSVPTFSSCQHLRTQRRHCDCEIIRLSHFSTASFWKFSGKICYLERLEASVALLSSSDTWDLIPK